MKTILWGLLSCAVAMMAVEAPLAAGANEIVPEISGATLSTGLGLLGAGVLWLRTRRGSK
jgi:hypothetical protein